MPKKSNTSVEEDKQQTCHVKIFYGSKEEVENEYNAFMHAQYKYITILENKSFYSRNTHNDLTIGLILYYLV